MFSKTAHLKVHDPTNPKRKFICTYKDKLGEACNAGFLHKGRLLRHEKSHSESDSTASTASTGSEVMIENNDEEEE